MQKMSDDRIAKQVLHWVPEDRSKRGRPRVTWQHAVIRLGEGRTVLGRSNVFDGRQKSGEIGLLNVLVTGRTKV